MKKRTMPSLFVAAALLLGASAAGAQPLVQGQRLGPLLTVGGKQIPLPPGEWMLAAEGTNRPDSDAAGPHGAIRNLFLFRVAGGRVEAVAEINTNAVPVDDGWGASRECKRKDLILAVTRYRSGWDSACFFVKRTRNFVSPAGPQAWSDASALAERNGWRMPAFWITSGFRVSDRQDIVDLRIHLNPEAAGLTGPADGGLAGWSPDSIKADPSRFRYFAELSAWAASFDAFIVKGMHNQFARDDVKEIPALPYVALPRSAQPTLDGKLLALERLYRAGLLSPASYRSQEQAALKDPLLVPEESSIPLSLQKNVSFRVFGSVVDYAIAFAVTLSAPISAYITASIVSIHSVIFVLNDNFWEDYFAKRSLHDPNRTVEFRYAGADLV